VGGFLLYSFTAQKEYFAFELAPLIAFNLNSDFVIEAGAGIEDWPGGYGDVGLLLLADVAWRLHGWGWLDRVFVGLSDYTGAPAGVTGTSSVLQFKAGLGVAF
jgi:hypothetical protein